MILNKKIIISFKLILLSVLIFGNYWFIDTFMSGDYFKTFYFLLSSFLLYYFSKLKKARYFIFLLPILIIILSFKYSNAIFNLNWEEVQIINQRRGYYNGNFFGRLFENKPNKFIYKFEKNLFQGLDVNYYFFANHPRERVEIIEKEKISFVFLPLFILGLISFCKEKKYFSILYFLICLFSASLFNPIDEFSFLFFPFFTITIFEGINSFVLLPILNKFNPSSRNSQAITMRKL